MRTCLKLCILIICFLRMSDRLWAGNAADADRQGNSPPLEEVRSGCTQSILGISNEMDGLEKVPITEVATVLALLKDDHGICDPSQFREAEGAYNLGAIENKTAASGKKKNQ